jgi:hypothetical protein
MMIMTIRSELDENIKIYEIEKNENIIALRAKTSQSHHLLINLIDHHHVFLIVLSITAECHFRAHELSTK